MTWNSEFRFFGITDFHFLGVGGGGGEFVKVAHLQVSFLTTFYGLYFSQYYMHRRYHYNPSTLPSNLEEFQT